MEDVRQLVRDDLPQPLLRPRPHLRNVVDVHPDIGEAVADWYGEPVRYLILIRQVDANWAIERHAEVGR